MQDKVTPFARQIQKVLSPKRLRELGASTGLCVRERTIMPQRLAIVFLISLACRKTKTLADIHRCFNEQFDVDVRYKPFHNQLAKPEFADFMRQLVEVTMTELSVRMLQAPIRSKLSEFSEILIQDGSSLTLHPKLKRIFPGRFSTISPAAFEIHATMEMFHNDVVELSIAPDTEGERAFLPDPKTMNGKLLLSDRGYEDRRYWEQLDQEGAAFVGRASLKSNPRIVKVFGSLSVRRLIDGRHLLDVLNYLPKKKRVDVLIEWDNMETVEPFRMVIGWSKEKKEWRFLVTNLAHGLYTKHDIEEIYRIRWQVELLFKEWKSQSNLSTFQTRNPVIAEALVWASIAAAIIKRFIANVTELTQQIPISSWKVAQCVGRLLEECLKSCWSQRACCRMFFQLVSFLAKQAKRSHPNRDAKTGRCLFLTTVRQ